MQMKAIVEGTVFLYVSAKSEMNNYQHLNICKALVDRDTVSLARYVSVKKRCLVEINIQTICNSVINREMDSQQVMGAGNTVINCPFSI